MITHKEGFVLDALPEYSVIPVQVDCSGNAGIRLSKILFEQYPGLKKAYVDHCALYKDALEDLLGKFIIYDISDKLKVCLAFAQIDVSKAGTTTDVSAWNKIFDMLERQIRAKNETDGTNWSVHVQDDLGIAEGGAEPGDMRDVMQFNFAMSPVELVVHTRKNDPPPEHDMLELLNTTVILKDVILHINDYCRGYDPYYDGI